jgi:hypothetical protein
MTTTFTATKFRSRMPAARRGFSFTEVLFAVMVLGLGFIMIAAIFPVTIRQTQSTLEETIGANVARGAVDYLQGMASEDLFPPTAPVDPTSYVYPVAKSPTSPTPPRMQQPALGAPPIPSEFVSLQDVKPYVVPVYNPGPTKTPVTWGGAAYDPDPSKNQYWPAYSAVRGNMIDPNNPAIAWVGFYRRDVGSQFAQVVVIAVRNRERDRYVASQNPLYVGATSGKMYSDLDRPSQTPTAPGTLEPVKVPIALQWDPNGSHGVVTFDTTVAGTARAATGAYLVVAVDPVARPLPNTRGQLIGRIFQLGNPINEAAGTWELSPAGDMVRLDPTKAPPKVATDDPTCALTDGVQAYLIGRGYVDPSDGTKGFAGPAQDIAVYTGFISIPPKTTTP